MFAVVLACLPKSFFIVLLPKKLCKESFVKNFHITNRIFFRPIWCDSYNRCLCMVYSGGVKPGRHGARAATARRPPTVSRSSPTRCGSTAPRAAGSGPLTLERSIHSCLVSDTCLCSSVHDLHSRFRFRDFATAFVVESFLVKPLKRSLGEREILDKVLMSSTTADSISGKNN